MAVCFQQGLPRLVSYHGLIFSLATLATLTMTMWLLLTLDTMTTLNSLTTLATLATLATCQTKVFLVETGEPGAMKGEVDKCGGEWSSWGECQGPGQVARAGQGRERECGGQGEGRWRSCGGGEGADYSTPLVCGGDWQDWGPCSRSHREVWLILRIWTIC